MATTPPQLDRSELHARLDQMLDELTQWRADRPDASFDEIVQQVTPRRQQLMGVIVEQLACQHGHGEVAEGLCCEQCGQPLRFKGRGSRQVEHLEGETRLKRGYYSCPHCHRGFFPPRSAAETAETRLESGHDSAGVASGGGGSFI